VATDAGPAVLLQNGRGLELRRLADGVESWRWEGDCAGIATTVGSAEMLFVPAGGIAAVPVGGREPVWRAAKLSPGIASPVAWDASIACLNRGGVLVVGNTADGDIRGQVRLAGTFWASPIVVGDTIVAVNTEGKTFLVAVDDKPEIVAENQLPGTFTATPAVVDGSLYLRSETALWKVAAPQ
jgi:hypothetical protein